METFEILGVVAAVGFLLIGVPIIAINSRNHALATRALVEPLMAQVARLQQQIDALRAQISTLSTPPVDARPAEVKPRAPTKQKASGPRVAESPGIPADSAALPPPLPPGLAARVAQPPPLPASLQPGPAPLPQPPRRDFEELIGTRWAIWIGGLALALGSLFLVRYTIEAGYFGPVARLLMATAFSFVLLCAGELLRRGAVLPRRLAEVPVEHAPLALTAAGIVGLFGTVYAAFAVYDFLPQTLTFVLLGLIGLAALGAALLHGQALAGVGLVASYATPVLIGGDSSNRWPLVIFLLAVTAAAMAVQNRLRTRWLGTAVIVGVGLWTALLIAGQDQLPVAELTFMLAAMAIFAAALCWFREEPTLLEGPQAVVAIAGLAAALGLSFVSHSGGAGLYAVAALLAVLIITATAAFSGRGASAIVAGGLLPLGMLLTWPSLQGSSLPAIRVIKGALLIVTTPPAAPGLLFPFGLGAAVLLAGLPLALFLRRTTPRVQHDVPGLMAIAITAGLAAPLLVLAWALRSEGLIQNLPAAAILAVLCGLLALATLRLLKGAQDDLARIGAGGYGAGAALALGLAIAFALPGLWMAVGFASAALAGAALSDRQQLPMLRRVVAAFSTTAVLRAVSAPLYQPETAWPVLNSYVAAYALPALLLAATASILSRHQQDRNVSVTGGASAALAALFAGYAIRHAFHGAELYDRFRFGLGESGLYVLACLLPCLILFGLRQRLGTERMEPFRRPAVAANMAGLLLVAVLVLGLGNPWGGVLISGPRVLDSSFVGLLLPALALGVLAYLGRTMPGFLTTRLVDANRIAAIALGYLYCAAQIRRFFAGTARFAFAPVGDVEHYAYSVGTLIFGVALLAIGFRLGSRPTRLASAIFVTLAVLKVFLFDMAELTGLLRALSFIGLGGVLIGIGLAYQRLLVDRDRRPHTDVSFAADKPSG